MKKILAAAIVVLIMPVLCFAMGGQAPEKSSSKSPVKRAAYPYLIDNFEDGNFEKSPEWFVFDGISTTIVKNTTLKGGDVSGQYSLNIKGTARDWYVGGMGTVLNIDASGYDTFEMDVYGNGENSGMLKVELYDDDNGNTDVEVDKNWKPTSDDLWSYELKIDWSGWKHVSIPVSQFKNFGKGDGVYNPNLKNSSGGLIKLQLICVASSQTGSIDFNLSNIELGVSK